jgi:hypothetical protein
MKRSLFFASIFGMMLVVFGLVLAGCDSPAGTNGTNESSKLAVKNLPSAGADVFVYKDSSIGAEQIGFDGYNNAEHKSPFNLSAGDNTPFTETGRFYVVVSSRSIEGIKYQDNVPFTNGSAELDWNTMIPLNNNGGNNNGNGGDNNGNNGGNNNGNEIAFDGVWTKAGQAGQADAQLSIAGNAWTFMNDYNEGYRGTFVRDAFTLEFTMTHADWGGGQWTPNASKARANYNFNGLNEMVITGFIPDEWGENWDYYLGGTWVR